MIVDVCGCVCVDGCVCVGCACYTVLQRAMSLKFRGAHHHQYKSPLTFCLSETQSHCKMLNPSNYIPKVPRGFQEVKAPRLREDGPGCW